MVTVHTGDSTHSTNHLLFIDDLKLLDASGDNLKAMVNETNQFFETIGLVINSEKSTTNEISYTIVQNFGGLGIYKHLGIVKNCISQPALIPIDIVKKKLLTRVERLCTS